MFFWNRKKLSTEIENKKNTEAEKMRKNLKEAYDDIQDFYFRTIIRLMRGSHQMGTGVILLSPISKWYKYYGIDNTIIYYDDKIRDMLLNEGIASYIDSARNLVITTSPERVKNMLKK